MVGLCVRINSPKRIERRERRETKEEEEDDDEEEEETLPGLVECDRLSARGYYYYYVLTLVRRRRLNLCIPRSLFSRSDKKMCIEDVNN